MSNFSWRTGVNMREFAFYTRPEVIEFAKTEPQRAHLRGLQSQQLNELKALKVKLVRFFGSHRALSVAENIQQVRAALDAINNAGMQAVISLADGLGSGYFVPGDEQYHTEPMGHLHKRYWTDKLYRQNYLPYVNQLTAALKDHPAALMWELGNEYAIHPLFAGTADIEAFLGFTREASAAIKGNAPNSLVSIGLINTNQIIQGGSEADRLNYAKRLYGLNDIDVVSLHVYAEDDEDNLAMIDVQAAKALGKAFYIGELGQEFKGGDRSGYYKATIQKWKDAGAASVMPWQFDTSNFDVGVSDLKAIARIHGDFDALKAVFGGFGVNVESVVVRINTVMPVGVPDDAVSGGNTTVISGNEVDPFWMLRPIQWKYEILARFNDPARYSGAPTKLQKREGMLFAPRPTDQSLEVRAAQRGVVDKIAFFGAGYGNYVIIRHSWNGDTYNTWYGHLAEVKVKQNQSVAAGDVIGIAGRSGSADEVSLFFTLQHVGKGLPNYVVTDVCDPEPLFRDSVEIRDEASWDADMTVDDGNVFEPGQTFKKMWRVRNTGTTTWDKNFVLAFHSGNPLGAGASILLPVPVQPGETLPIGLTMIAPEEPGTYRSQWMMRNSRGQFFPGEIYTEIVVRDVYAPVGRSLARFVSDVSIPDGTILRPGQKFTKTWRIWNDGDTTWGDGFVLAFSQHMQMSGPESVPLPKIKPGKQGEVSVDLVAPMTPGRYFTMWKPRDPQGNSFDFEMYADITVQNQTINAAEKFPVPVSGAYRLGTGYLGTVWYLDGKHKGIDFLSPNSTTMGQSILAGGNGVVYRSHRCPRCTLTQPNWDSQGLTDAERSAGFSDWNNWSWGFGHLVIVRYAWSDLPENARRAMKAQGFENWYAYAYYAHLSEICVAEGAVVVAGQEIAKLGNSGNTNWPHLHLEVRIAKTDTNDMAFPNGATTADRYRTFDPSLMFNLT